MENGICQTQPGISKAGTNPWPSCGGRRWSGYTRPKTGTGIDRPAPNSTRCHPDFGDSLAAAPRPRRVVSAAMEKKLTFLQTVFTAGVFSAVSFWLAAVLPAPRARVRVLGA